MNGSLFLERLLDADAGSLDPTGSLDLAGYLDLAIRSGIPGGGAASGRTGASGVADSYVDQLITRDAPAIAGARDPDRLRRYLEALTVNSAAVVEGKTLYEAVGIDRKTTVAYEQLLKTLLVVELLPGWESNRLSRLTRLPKRCLVEPAFTATVLRLDASALLRDGNLLCRIIDTFVAAQIRRTWQSQPPGHAGTTRATRAAATKSI